jgi:hypothetical protein
MDLPMVHRLCGRKSEGWRFEPRCTPQDVKDSGLPCPEGLLLGTSPSDTPKSQDNSKLGHPWDACFGCAPKGRRDEAHAK